MPLKTIEARFADEPVKVGDPEAHRVLTRLKMIYEGGSFDGKTASFPTRDLSCVVVGRHRGNRHFFEAYERTIWINRRNQRTTFRCAGLIVQSNNSSRWKRLLATLHIRKLKAIIV